MFAFIRNLYDRMLTLSQHPKAVYWLGGISFLESSFFPIPPDVMLAPMCLANRRRAFFYAFVCTAASVLGGLLGYAIGLFAFEAIGQPILDFYGVAAKYETFEAWYAQYGAAVTFIAGLTPIPYKVVTISAGVFQFNLALFVMFSVLARGMRFFLEAFLIHRFGEPAMKLIDRHFNTLTIIGAVLFVGGFVVIRFLMPH